MNRENSKGDTDTLSIGPTSRLVRVKLGFDRLLQPGVVLRWAWGCRNQSYSQLNADLWSQKERPKSGRKTAVPVFSPVWTAALASSLVPTTSNQTNYAEAFGRE